MSDDFNWQCTYYEILTILVEIEVWEDQNYEDDNDDINKKAVLTSVIKENM